MRAKDIQRGHDLQAKLFNHDKSIRNLPGIRDAAASNVLIEQLIESLRRIEYVHFVRSENFDIRRADPNSAIFDPIRAAVFQMRQGSFDEAFWLVFLFVLFGKHKTDHWQLVRDIYGGLGSGTWTWDRLVQKPEAFRKWLEANLDQLRNDGTSRRFGNHRKYESLESVADVVESYVSWVAPPRTHQQMIQQVHVQVGQNPNLVFDYLYQSMNSVHRFGRLARFDYLTMLSKLGLAPIEPASAYLNNATGPRAGALLLFGGSTEAKIIGSDLNTFLSELDGSLGVGMQVLEDALCNWQKSPTVFIPFR